MTRALGIYSAQRRAQVLSAGRKTPFLMVGTEMQAPAPLGTTVVLSFAKYGEDTKLDLKNSSWQQRIFDSDLWICTDPQIVMYGRDDANQREDRGHPWLMFI